MTTARCVFNGILVLCIVVVVLNSARISWIRTENSIRFLSAKLKIAIIVVLEPNSRDFYTRALESVLCYSQIHNYSFIVAETANYAVKCPHKDKFFRRHCVVEQLLPGYDYVLFLDADIGVVNPKRKIEEYIDPTYDVSFYDRFYNQEIMAGSYLLKNSPYSLQFIKDFADYEYRLPNSFHGTDNGAIEVFMAEKIFPSRPEEYKVCLELWNISSSYEDLFAYEACIRAVLGATENFERIRIMRKGAGWARDGWTTNSLWDPSRDFMFHGWKTNTQTRFQSQQLPIKPTHSNNQNWYDPTIGSFDFDKCIPGNTTWNHDPNLISTSGEVQKALDGYREEVRRDYYRKLAHISKILNYRKK